MNFVNAGVCFPSSESQYELNENKKQNKNNMHDGLDKV